MTKRGKCAVIFEVAELVVDIGSGRGNASFADETIQCSLRRSAGAKMLDIIVGTDQKDREVGERHVPGQFRWSRCSSYSAPFDCWHVKVVGKRVDTDQKDSNVGDEVRCKCGVFALLLLLSMVSSRIGM